MLTHLEMGLSGGRFGNQLFQMAALMGISTHQGVPFRLPLENLKPDFGSFLDPVTGTQHALS